MRITLNNDLVEIDDEIVSGIKLFNDKGWRTDFSCAGHYKSEDKYPFSFPYVSFDYLSNNRFFTLFEKVPESVFESFDVEIVIMGENDDRLLYVAIQVLDYAICSAPGAPLKKALIEKGIDPERIHKYGFAFAGKEVLIG